MAVTRRVYVSLPADQWLTSAENDFKWALVEMIERRGFFPEVFHDPQPRHGLASGQAWSPDTADAVARRCVGAVIIGLPRWVYDLSEGEHRHATEYSHYEGALSRTLGLPLLLLAEQGLIRRGIFNTSVGYITEFPRDVGRAWLETSAFSTPFVRWIEDLRRRRDIFLGYCGTSERTAQQVKAFLEQDIGASVLDWKSDFLPAGSILEQIHDAAALCSAGIFLFTKDDKLGVDGAQAAPRDNVVFEAGYFAAAKGKHRVLIIRESGSKMPADLGGDIYATLENRADIDPIREQIRRFVRSRL